LFDARVERGGGDYDSVCGRISTRWRRLGAGQFTLDVSLPANSSGEIHLPAAGGAIREGGRGLSNRAGISVVASGAKETIVRVGSGDYSFRAV
jgi:alpha-L-rhamnosidase